MHEVYVCMEMLLISAVLAAFSASVTQVLGEDYPYMIGVGRYDITGPAAQVNVFGYSSPARTAEGIHFRQWSRAFVIADAHESSRVVFVNIDAVAGTQILKIKVVEKLNSLYPSLYSYDNVCISGTDTHSGPGGFFQYFLYQIPSLGFVEENLDAMVDGIVSSIQEAHESMRPAKLFYNQGQCLNASVNRSPTAYALNPDHDQYEFDTDKEMTVLKMVNSAGEEFGMISWFAVHGTSMNSSNRLISGDNKGYASMLMEEAMDPGSIAGQGKYVAAFAQSNEGDVSPNINGPVCIYSGAQCDAITSKCADDEPCIAFGPGKDMFESTQIIGERQFITGKALFDWASTEITGPVDYVHAFRNMSNISLLFSDESVKTCRPAMGFSFAAGTTDGGGAPHTFTQGDTVGQPVEVRLIRDLLHKPSHEQVQCQSPKPILLDTGNFNWLYPWQPEIVPLQIMRVGQLVLIAVPGDFTTMAGRYLRENVSNVLLENGFDENIIPVIVGSSNTYSSYVTTFYEYQQQRYEAASTMFGPHTLDAYVQEYNSLAAHLADKSMTVDPGPDSPPNYYDIQQEHLPEVKFDRVPFFKSFGDVKENAKDTYSVGDVAYVSFWGANPRNNLMDGGTFLTVEWKKSDNSWDVICTDSCWETKFHWERPYSPDFVGHTSIVTVEWDIPESTPSGTYRIQHFGHYLTITGKIKPYNGLSREFVVQAT